MAHKYLGRLPQGRDDRDHIRLVSRRIAASLPVMVNLGANMPMHLNQGAEGSCGPTTLAEMLAYEQKAAAMLVDIPSRQFLYWWTRFLMNTVSQDSGVDNRTLMKVAATYGECSETLWPYDISKMTVKPPDSCTQAALPNRIVDYAAVLVNEVQIKGTIAEGNTVMFGFDVFKGMMTDQAEATGVIPVPKTGETPVGGHDVCAYAYDDTLQLLDCRNHWDRDDGTPWGYGPGDVRIPYKYAFNPKWVSDLWTVKTIPGGVPVPPPLPPSPPPPTAPGWVKAMFEQLYRDIEARAQK